jgi:ribosome maturation factor RimP
MQLFAQRIQGIDRASLEAAISPVLRAHRVETAEITYQIERGGWVLRVTVESLDDSPARPAFSRSEDAPGALPAWSSEEVHEGTPSSVDRVAPIGSEGIHLGLLAEISRDLSSVLDVADIIPHRYQLEVSSPGADRPLRSPHDFGRALGKVAKVHLARPAPDGQRVLRGPIVQALPDAVRIDVDGKPRDVRLEDIERAHLIFELPAQPKGRRAKPNQPTRH